MPRNKRRRTSTTYTGKNTSDKQADDSNLERKSSPVRTAEKITIQQSSDGVNCSEKLGIELALKQSNLGQSSMILKSFPQNVTIGPEIASELSNTIPLESQFAPETQPASDQTFFMPEPFHENADSALDTANADKQSSKSSPKTTSSSKMDQIWGSIPNDLHNFLVQVSKSINATHFLKYLEEEKARYNSPEYVEETKEMDYTYGDLLEQAMEKVPIKTDIKSLLKALDQQEAFRTAMFQCLIEETSRLEAANKSGESDLTTSCGYSDAAYMNYSDANRESESDDERKSNTSEQSSVPSEPFSYVSFINLGKNRTNDTSRPMLKQTDKESDFPCPEILSGPQQKKLRNLAVRVLPERGRIIFDCRPTWCQDLSAENQANRFVAIQGGSICSAFPRSLFYNRCGCLFIPNTPIRYPIPTSTTMQYQPIISEKLQTLKGSEIGGEMSTPNSDMDPIDEELYYKLKTFQISSDAMKMIDEFDTFRRVYPCHSYISAIRTKRPKPWEYRTEDDMFPNKEIEEQRRISEQLLYSEKTGICGIWHDAVHLAYNMYRHRGVVQTTAVTMRNMQEYLLRFRDMELESQDKDCVDIPRLRIAIHDDDEQSDKPGYPFFGRPGHLFPTIISSESLVPRQSTSSRSGHGPYKDDVELLSTNVPEPNKGETSPANAKTGEGRVS